jgi:hypothetical protein
MHVSNMRDQARPMKPLREQIIRGNRTEVIQVRIPRNPGTLVADELGNTYLSLSRSVMGGEIEFRLYGINSQRVLDRAAETNVRAMICRIICGTYENAQKKQVRVEMQVVARLAPTHRLGFYVRRSYIEQPGHVYHYDIPQTNGGFEIIKL